MLILVTGLLTSALTYLMLQNHLQRPEMKSISNPMRNGFEASPRRQINCGNIHNYLFLC